MIEKKSPEKPSVSSPAAVNVKQALPLPEIKPIEVQEEVIGPQGANVSSPGQEMYAFAYTSAVSTDDVAYTNATPDDPGDGINLLDTILKALEDQPSNPERDQFKFFFKHVKDTVLQLRSKKTPEGTDEGA